MSIIDELKQNFKTGGLLIKLLYINIGIFLIVNIIDGICFLFKYPMLGTAITYWLSVPDGLHTLVSRPWTVISYQFLHKDIFHILFNMLWLYWFGQIFLQYLDQKKMLIVYLLGGLSGAGLYLLAYNTLPVFTASSDDSILLGASASIMAIVIAISLYVPNYTINLLFFGSVRLKYLALVTIILDFILIGVSNPGGHISHLGGALFGYLYIKQLKKGKDFTTGFAKLTDFIGRLFTRKPKMKVTHGRPVDDLEYNRRKNNQQKEIDRILDKISKGGYESLTKEEKDFLFKAGK